MFIRVTEVVFIRVILSAIYEPTLFNENQTELGRLSEDLQLKFRGKISLQSTRKLIDNRLHSWTRARFSKVPKRFGCSSSDLIFFVSSKQRRLEARNFAVI